MLIFHDVKLCGEIMKEDNIDHSLPEEIRHVDLPPLACNTETESIYYE